MSLQGIAHHASMLGKRAQIAMRGHLRSSCALRRMRLQYTLIGKFGLLPDLTLAWPQPEEMATQTPKHRAHAPSLPMWFWAVAWAKSANVHSAQTLCMGLGDDQAAVHPMQAQSDRNPQAPATEDLWSDKHAPTNEVMHNLRIGRVWQGGYDDDQAEKPREPRRAEGEAKHIHDIIVIS